MTYLSLLIILLLFQQPQVEIQDNKRAVKLLSEGVYKVQGKGKVILEEGKTKLIFESTLRAENESLPLQFIDKEGSEIWVIHLVDDLPKSPGTSIHDSKKDGSSSISSTDTITFYLKLSETGDVILFQPLD